MNVEELKKLDPFQTMLIIALDRIARSLERLVDNDETR